MEEKKMSKKSFSRKVLEKLMNPEELEAFLVRYNENSVRGGINRTRFVKLQDPISEEEKELLRRYFNEEIKILQDVEPSLKASTILSRVKMTAIRFVYQN